MTALCKPFPPLRMTAAEFLAWEPPEHPDRRWQLVDGEPVAMAPAGDDHGRIQAELAFLLTAHLRANRPGCDVVVAPGIVPRVRSRMNHRVPDLGVTCAPPAGRQTMADPVLLVDILSPSNERLTRANVWAYATIPSVREILLLASTEIAAELLRRGADGNWPDLAGTVRDGEDLDLASIGFRVPLREFYRTTSLVRR